MNLINSRDILSLLFNIQKENLVSFLSSKINNLNGTIIVKGPLKLDVTIDENKININKLPILKFFPKEGGLGYITAGIIVTEYNGIFNASIHRLMVLDNNQLVIRIVPTRHLSNLYNNASSVNKKLQIAILIGADPVVIYACSTRVPPSKEFIYASTLKNEPLHLFSCSNGINVPFSEIIMEGYIDPLKTEFEGPFVDLTGTYDICRKEPVIYITKIHYQKNPIYQTILPASLEHFLIMGTPYEAKIFNFVNDVTIVKNVILTEGSCCYFHAIVQIKKETEGDAKSAIIASFAAHPSLKHVIIIDDDIDIYNPLDIEYAIATCVNGDKNILIVKNIRGSSLDPCCSKDGTITKIGIDATKPLVKNSKFQRVLKYL